MKNLNKMSSAELRNKLAKIVRVQERTSAFDNLMHDIDAELNRRNRAAIYRVACKVLKNDGMNQFWMASRYADDVINSSDYFSSDQSHEIGSFYTKSGCGAVVVVF